MTNAPPDFDFLVGKWRVHHTQLKERLAGCHDWIEFSGTSELWLIMNGLGTLDDNVIDKPGGSYRAITLRSYDAKTRTWAIWWLDARFPHRIEPPTNWRMRFTRVT